MRRKKNKQLQGNKLLLKSRRPKGFTYIRYYYEGIYLFFNKSYRIEFKYIVMLKRFLKKLKRRGIKKQKSIAYKLYVSLSQNYMLSKKSKNSRMGKGKGSFVREAIKVKKFRPFIYSNGHRLKSLTKLASRFSVKTNKSLSCFSSVGFDRTYSWTSNKYVYCYSKPFLLV